MQISDHVITGGAKPCQWRKTHVSRGFRGCFVDHPAKRRSEDLENSNALFGA